MDHIEQYISELIEKNDCVIVPGLGAFIAQPTSADIHPITHKFTPPGRTIGFNSQIKVNDGLLASFISSAESIAFTEASTRIDDFVKAFQSHIHTHKNFTIKNVGRFFFNLEGKLEFEPDYNRNFSSDSFALTEFVFKPIERTSLDMTQPSHHRKAKGETTFSEQEETVTKKKTSSATKLLLIMMPLLVMIGAAGYVVYNQQLDISVGGMTLFSAPKTEKELVKTDTVTASAADTVTAVDQILAENIQAGNALETESAESAVSANADMKAGTFYVVLGAFKNEQNADKLYNKLSGSGVEVVKIPVDRGNFYKVAVGPYASKEEAEASKNKLDDSYKGIWIKKY